MNLLHYYFRSTIIQLDNTRILCVCVHLCVCLLTNEISGTGHCIATFVSLMWASCTCSELRSWVDKMRGSREKPLEFFAGNAWNHAHHITMVRYLSTWSSSPNGLSIYTFSRDTARKKNVFAVWEALLLRGRSCYIREQAMARSPPFSSQRPPLSALQRSPLSASGCIYNKLMGKHLSFLTFSWDAAKKTTVLAVHNT